MTTAMKINALAGWFGANRMLADRVGKELGPLAWCGIPFCGGCCEIPHIKTRSGLANDLHRHIVNLARCVRDDELFAELQAACDRVLFHPDELRLAQSRCVEREAARAGGGLFGSAAAGDTGPDVEWAADYFMACWMGRGGHAGKRHEFTQGLAIRYTSSGGDSATRYRSAVASLPAWNKALKAWNFTCDDAFSMLDRAKDVDSHGLYVDAPWPDAGEEYRHAFDDKKQIRLAERLARFKAARIVVRYGDHPLIRDLYPADRWNWIEQSSVNQVGGEVNEVLITNHKPAARSAQNTATKKGR